MNLQNSVLEVEFDRNEKETCDSKSVVSKDIATKMKIAKSIIEACTVESTEDLKPAKFNLRIQDTQGRLRFYTKADGYLIFKARKSLKLEKSFTEWTDELPSSGDLWESLDKVRNLLYDSYINKRKIPSKAEIVHDARIKPSYAATIIFKTGFTWLPLPGTKYNIAVERPEQFHRRIRYLEAIIRLRQLGREFVYIEQKKFVNNRNHFQESYNVGNKASFIYLMAAGRNGFLNRGILKACATPNSPQFLEQFFINQVLPYIKPSTTIVINDVPNQLDKKINEYSSRSEIIDWLEKNNVPHDPKVHKAELYALIEKTRRSDTVDDGFDQWVKGYGFEVLHRPPDTCETNFFQRIWNDSDARRAELKLKIHLMSELLYNITEVTTSYNMENWFDIEKDLIQREKNVYEKDRQMEEIVDKLMMMAKDGQISRKDLGFNFKSEKPIDDMLSNIIID